MVNRRRMLSLLLPVACPDAVLAAQTPARENAGKYATDPSAQTEPPSAWPRNFVTRNPTPVVKESREKGDGAFLYESADAWVTSDESLKPGEAREIIVAFASVQPALEALPLPLVSSRRRRKDKKPRLRIFSNASDYHAYGGRTGTVGMFYGRRRETLVLRESLLAQGKPATRAADDDRFDLVVHEGTHHVMRRLLFYLPTWYKEGLAEYMAAAHHRPGRYAFFGMENRIVRHMARYLHGNGSRLLLPTVESLLEMNQHQWDVDNKAESDANYIKYGAALILTHYFHHLDGSDARAIRAFLSAIVSGVPHPKAMRRHLRRRDGREIQRSLRRHWRKSGLEIGFASRD